MHLTNHYTIFHRASIKEQCQKFSIEYERIFAYDGEYNKKELMFDIRIVGESHGWLQCAAAK